MKAPAKLDFCSRACRIVGQALNQGASLDNQIWLLQYHCRGAPVGEKLETANFVEDAALGAVTEKVTHPAGHDQGSRLRLQRLCSFQDTHCQAALRQQPRREQPRSRPANHRDVWSLHTLVLQSL